MDDLISGAAIFQACYRVLPAKAQDGQTITAQLSFPTDFPAFVGHFPDDPILPGFMQIELALDMLRRVNMPAQLQAVDQARFLLPMRPGQAVHILLTPLRPQCFHLELQVNGELCSVMEITVN